MLFMITRMLYVREVVIVVADSAAHACVHMVTISNAGIDPRTTPVYARYVKFSVLRGALVACAGLVLVEGSVSISVTVVYPIGETIDDAIGPLFLLEIGAAFLLWAADASGGYGVTVHIEDALDVEIDTEVGDVEGAGLKAGGTR